MIDGRIAVGAIAVLLIAWGLIREHRRDMRDLANYRTRPDERDTLSAWWRNWRA